ncbi:CBU_0592 family membrane protein [Rhodopila sp.]|uniref:CBU_0592 family membrane protein n=1 Tax=Rhodopila sp. TaxID=2480087 RepID=UPI003D0E2E56
MGLALQFAGAIAILAAFGLMLLGRMGRQDRAYLVLNLAGAALLTVDAWLEHQYGFVLLQAVWAVVAGWGLIRRPRGARPSRPQR